MGPTKGGSKGLPYSGPLGLRALLLCKKVLPIGCPLKDLPYIALTMRRAVDVLCCATWQRSLARVSPKEGGGGGGCPGLTVVDGATERSAKVTPASVSAAPSLQALFDAAPLTLSRLEDMKATRDRRPPCDLRVANVQPHGSGEGGSRKEHVCIRVYVTLAS